MRILIATEVFPPAMSGVAVTAERQARLLAARGHQVIVTTASPDYRFHAEETAGYTVYRFPSWINPFRPSLRFTVFPFRYMRKRFVDFKPEVVHLHDPAAICRVAIFLANQRDIPIVFTKHFILDYVMAYLRWMKWARRAVEVPLKSNFLSLYNKCSLIVVPSQTMKRYLEGQEEKGLKVPVEVVSNGVDAERFQRPAPPDALAQYGLAPDLPTLAYVGRIDPDKNLEVLLEALAIVQKKRPVQTVLVGKGVSLAKLRERARRLGLRNLVWIPRLESQGEALVALYQRADAFCLPCAIETESMVTMEAMAAGLPVVAANAGALPELVEDGVTGRLVDPEDVSAWAQAVVGLLADPALGRRMGEKGRAKVRRRDVAKSIERLEALYAKLVLTAKGSAAGSE